VGAAAPRLTPMKEERLKKKEGARLRRDSRWKKEE
jgi:hypothetical protein